MKKLVEKKEDLLLEMEQILSACETEVRSLSSEEDVRFAELKLEIEKIDKTLALAEEKRNKATTEVVENKIQEKIEERGKEEMKLEQRSNLVSDLRAGKDVAKFEIETEVRDYNVGTGAAGYNSANKGQMNVPLTIEDAILKAIDFYNPILGHCNVIRTEGTHRIVMDTAPESEARLVKEGAAIGTIDSEFKKVELGAYKFGEIVKFTSEVLQDTNFDIAGHAANRLGRSLAKALEKHLIQGTGSEQPQGLLQYVTGSTAQDAKEVTTAKADTIALDDVINAYYNMPHEMRNGMVFLCHPTVVQKLALLKDGFGRPLLNPSINGEFYTIMGCRIIETPYLPEVGSGSKSAMFVKLSDALTVGLRKDITVRHLNELYAANDLLAILGLFRFDSKIVYHGAISAIKFGA